MPLALAELHGVALPLIVSRSDMSQEIIPGEGRSILAIVSLRAAVDPGFRKRLLRNPRRAIRESFGVEVLPGLRLKFIEKGKHLDLLVVLPDLVGDADQVPADQLDVVIGGAWESVRALAAEQPLSWARWG